MILCALDVESYVGLHTQIHRGGLLNHQSVPIGEGIQERRHEHADLLQRLAGPYNSWQVGHSHLEKA